MWVSKAVHMKRNISTDGGKSFEPVTDTLLFGFHFFLSNKIMVHKKHAFNALDLLSKFGGLFSSVAQFLGVIGIFLNRRFLIGKIMGALYLISAPKK